MKSNAITRRLTTFTLFSSLVLGSGSAFGQDAPPPPGGETEGRVFDGYFLTGCLAFAALFVVGKSSRRS